MANAKFELGDEQQARMDAWFKHHWEVVHKGGRPRDMSGFAGFFLFGPTGCGCNVKYECAWCPDGDARRAVDLTLDEDDGTFIYEYDDDWNRLPAAWEADAPRK